MLIFSPILVSFKACKLYFPLSTLMTKGSNILQILIEFAFRLESLSQKNVSKLLGKYSRPESMSVFSISNLFKLFKFFKGSKEPKKRLRIPLSKSFRQ